MDDLLRDTAHRATRYLEGLASRGVAPAPAAVARLEELGGPLPDNPTDPAAVVALLDEIAAPATVVNAGGRYFGFVNGGSLPAALAANWLAGAWDQNAGPSPASPMGAALEEISIRWILDALGLPATAGGGLVTGATMANFAGLAAARHALLQRQGWDVEQDGMFGAPPLTVVVGNEVHVSVLKALSLVGLGRERVVRVPTDAQGRLRADRLPALSSTTIVCIQAGNVNTGALDPAQAVCARARDAGSWVHVDGAFGLWAAAAPGRRHLAAGLELPDSWATDCHKWLNVPYDCGVVLVANPRDLEAAMSASAASYLAQGAERHPFRYTPEMSRRARGVEVWAALRSLGRAGLAELIERTCRHAARFADGLHAAGYAVLNDVVLNQVLVSFGDADTTNRVIAAIQEDGTCWCGGTVWQGRAAMRISVSSWATTAEDVDASLAAMLRAARRIAAPTVSRQPEDARATG
jgi:glutamate/tyrosine decarboxylase-like PLP-dependent enzyme